MNFISWLLVYLEKVEGKKYTKRQLINHLKSLFGYQLKEGFMPFDGKHFGDCTGENCVCKLCLYEKYLTKYREYVKQSCLKN